MYKEAYDHPEWDGPLGVLVHGSHALGLLAKRVCREKAALCEVQPWDKQPSRQRPMTGRVRACSEPRSKSSRQSRLPTLANTACTESKELLIQSCICLSIVHLPINHCSQILTHKRYASGQQVRAQEHRGCRKLLLSGLIFLSVTTQSRSCMSKQQNIIKKRNLYTVEQSMGNGKWKNMKNLGEVAA